MIFDNVKKAVFIGAHTDDEMVCAGTLRKLVKSGVEVKVIAFSCAPIPGKSQEDTERILGREFAKAMKTIGVSLVNWVLLDFDPRSFSSGEDEIRQILYDYVVKEKPDIAFVLSPEDDHQSHAIVGKSAERVMKNRVPLVLRCHYPWNFINPGRRNLFVKLTPDEFETKLTVIRAYKSQHFRYDYENLYTAFTRVDGLATKNELAEAFEITYLIA
ncbi:MAG: PIG-L family deacetylase [Patescibacteria group bacterium]